MTRALTATFFAGAILAFALPFGAVSSCSGTEVRFTGAELATYSVPGESYSERELATSVERAASPFVLAALAFAGAGLVLLALGRSGVGACAALGVAAIQLVLYGILVASDDSNLFYGYALSLLGFVGAGVVCLVVAVRARRASSRSSWPPYARALAVLLPPLGLVLSGVLSALVWLVRRVRSRGEPRAAPV